MSIAFADFKFFFKGEKTEIKPKQDLKKGKKWTWKE